ncbi:MAG: hypothetical protein ACOCYC_02605 [bacterium]
MLLTALVSCASTAEVEASAAIPDYGNYFAYRGVGVAVPDDWFFARRSRSDSPDTLYRFEDAAGSAYGSIERVRAAIEDPASFLRHVELNALRPADRTVAFHYLSETGSIPVVGARLVSGWELFSAALTLGADDFVLTAAFDTERYRNPWLAFQGLLRTAEAVDATILVRRFPESLAVRFTDHAHDWIGEHDDAVYFNLNGLGGVVRCGVHTRQPTTFFRGDRGTHAVDLDSGGRWTRMSESTAVCVLPLTDGPRPLHLSFVYPSLDGEGPESMPAALIEEMRDEILERG